MVNHPCTAWRISGAVSDLVTLLEMPYPHPTPNQLRTMYKCGCDQSEEATAKGMHRERSERVVKNCTGGRALGRELGTMAEGIHQCA